MSDAEPVDPFDEFNKAAGAGEADPYPGFAEARRQGGLHSGIGLALGGADGDELPDESAEDMPSLFTAYSFKAVSHVLRDGVTFSSAAYAVVMGPVFGRSILEMDEPEHHTYRALLQQAFTRKAMEGWEGDLVEPIVHGLIDGFVADGRADLVRQLHFPFPMTVIAGLMGLPDSSLDDFHRLGVEIISVSFNPEGAMAASARLGEMFGEQLAQRRAAAEPVTDRSDIIAVLAHAELDGQRLTNDEILAFLRLLLPAGAETTYRSSANLMTGLLTHPDQLAALRADRDLLPQAIEEGLRWECPLNTIVRLATRDTVVAGVDVPAGSAVVTLLGSANHDETRWDDPESFDIFREPRSHLAFAAGPHLCLGMHLARMETRVVVNALLDRLPNLRLDPEAEPPVIRGTTFRSPLSLPVVWDT